jgi:hypothetical protein
VERKRRYPAKTSINRYLVRDIFGTELVKELLIPCFIDDYNQNIDSIDLVN